MLTPSSLRFLGNASETAFASPQAAARRSRHAVIREHGKMWRCSAREKSIVSSGDDVADAAARKRFVEAYERSMKFARRITAPPSSYIGKDDFPFPIPVVADGGNWRFDTAAGAEEILDRRIGRTSCRPFRCSSLCRCAARVRRGRSRRERPQYAQRLLSSEGKQDGLYWPTAESAPDSPFGPLIAEAQRKAIERRQTSRSPTTAICSAFSPRRARMPPAANE